MPKLKDLDRKLEFAGARDQAGAAMMGAGATSLIYDRKTGKLLGAYVDDETPAPGQAAVCRKLKQMGVKLVVAGVPMGREPGHIKGVTYAQEWYPYHSGHPAWAWGELPPRDAYILQSDYPGFADGNPPSKKQRQTLLKQAKAHKPKLTLLY
jgi:hypothetical protein